MMGIEHLHNIAGLDGATVTAIADPHGPSLRSASDAWNGELTEFEDHRELLSSGLCDAVVVATPNHTHVDVMVDVVASGLPVLVEKPLCTTVEGCRTVMAAAEEAPGMVWVGLEYRYMPPVARLIEEVRDGTVGQVRMVAIREHRFPFLSKVGDWNRSTANTGGTLVEKCCHFFDLMRVIIGTDPVSIFASGGHDVNHLVGDETGPASDMLDNAFVIVDFEGGVRAMLDLCMFADATKNQEEVVVVGDKGKVEALIPESTVRIGRRGQHWIGEVTEFTVTDETVKVAGDHHGSSFLELARFTTAILEGAPLELEGFTEAIRSGARPEVTLADGLWSVAMGEAAHLSIERGHPVTLAEVMGR